MSLSRTMSFMDASASVAAGVLLQAVLFLLVLEAQFLLLRDANRCGDGCLLRSLTLDSSLHAHPEAWHSMVQHMQQA